MSSYYDSQNRIIPNAGTYMADQMKAKSAYERSVAQLKAQRARQQIQSGLRDDWQVDPRAQYGAYQQMLQGQGSELDAAQEMSQARGFFGGGLGNQGQSMLRYGHAVANLGFKNQLADWENQYQMGLAEAQRAQQEANMGSLEGAWGSAVDEGDYSFPIAPSSSKLLYPKPKTSQQIIQAVIKAPAVKKYYAKGETKGSKKKQISGRQEY